MRTERTVKATDHLRKSKVLLMITALICLLLVNVPSSFADDAASSGATVTVSISCGDHGTVNANSGEFAEVITSGSDLHLVIAADEGYLIGSVLINDEPLAASDLVGIAGETSGQLDLEGLEDDLSVQITFMTEAEYEEYKGESGIVTDPFAGDVTGGGDTDDGAGATVYDPENGDASQQDDEDSGTTEDQEQTDDSDSGQDDDEGFEPDDDWGTDDDEADLEMDDSEGYQGTNDDEDGYENTSEDSQQYETDEAEIIEISGTVDAAATDSTSGTDKITDIGTAASTVVEADDDDSDSETDGKGGYYDDYSTPRTGDESMALPTVMILFGCSLLCLSGIIALRRREDAEEGGGQK